MTFLPFRGSLQYNYNGGGWCGGPLHDTMTLTMTDVRLQPTSACIVQTALYWQHLLLLSHLIWYININNYITQYYNINNITIYKAYPCSKINDRKEGLQNMKSLKALNFIRNILKILLKTNRGGSADLITIYWPDISNNYIP